MKGIKQIRFSQLNKSWPGLTLLKNTEISVSRDQVMVLSGENGSGKTTLLRILAGLEKPDSAMVQIGDTKSDWRRARRALMENSMYLHQQPYMFEGTVLHNLSICLPGLLRKKESYELLNEALEWGMLTRHAFSNAKTLSGGQQQRVALARAWLRRSTFLYLDEPISNMDSESSARTLELLSHLKSSGVAIVVCTHNAQYFEGIADNNTLLANHHVTDLKSIRNKGNIAYLKGTSPDQFAN